jgi:hypothetical protein
MGTIQRWGAPGVPLLTFVFLLLWWRRHGKEPALGSVVPQWRPSEDLRPGTAGALVDQRADMDDVIATILDLAVRGHVRIVEVPPEIPLGLEPDSLAGKILGGVAGRRQDWELVRLRPGEETGLREFEADARTGLRGATTRRLSDLKNKFCKRLPGIRRRLRELVWRKFRAEARVSPRAVGRARDLVLVARSRSGSSRSASTTGWSCPR